MIAGPGRRRLLSTDQVRYAVRAHRSGVTITAIARKLQVGRSTVHRELRRAGAA